MEKNFSRNLYNSTGSKKSARNILSCTDLNQIFDHPCVPIELTNPKTYGQESRCSLERLTSFNTCLIHCTMSDPFGDSSFVSSIISLSGYSKIINAVIHGCSTCQINQEPLGNLLDRDYCHPVFLYFPCKPLHVKSVVGFL